MLFLIDENLDFNFAGKRKKVVLRVWRFGMCNPSDVFQCGNEYYL